MSMTPSSHETAVAFGVHLRSWRMILGQWVAANSTAPTAPSRRSDAGQATLPTTTNGPPLGAPCIILLRTRGASYLRNSYPVS
jgi:hypothetical protein